MEKRLAGVRRFLSNTTKNTRSKVYIGLILRALHDAMHSRDITCSDSDSLNYSNSCVGKFVGTSHDSKENTVFETIHFVLLKKKKT